jgi:hypothetical protein
MTAYDRVRGPSHRAAHLALPGSRTALCGASPRRGEWVSADGFPGCCACASAARVAEAVAAWDAPPPRPGVLAMVYRGGCMRSAGECARCGNVRVLRQRGLCQPCVRSATRDGSIDGYGWTRADRLAEYAGYRARGLNIREAAERTGVSRRVGDRYEADLAASGRAPWRTAGATGTRGELRRAS